MTHSPDPVRIRRLIADLAKPRQDIEAGFVAVGSRLTEGAALLNVLSKLFEALPGALQGADVEEATGHLQSVATRAAALSDTFAQEKADLSRLVEVVAAASAPIADLRRTVKMMGIVSVNARVTAAGIVGDLEDFDVFTTDIAGLSDSASRTIQDFAQVYRQLTTEVDKAAAQRSRFETAHAQTLSGLADSLAETLDALARQRSLAVESSAATGRVSRQIVQQIASAVMSLQVGDATRQRIEHIETGLACLADIASGRPAFEAAIAPEQVPSASAHLAALEQALLTDTAATFAQEIGDASAALSALAADARTIMAHSRGFHGDDGSKSSVIASLSAQLRSAVTMLKDFEAERGKLEVVAAAVQDTVGMLLEHVGAVQEIEANMRLVSLNAAVRCAQLGPRGASLNVIATQLRELTSETVVAAEAAMARLDESSTLAGAFGAAAAGAGTGQIGELEGRANLALTILGSLDNTIAEALRQLNADGPKVIGLLDGAADALSRQSAMVETLDDLALAIAGLAPADQASAADAQLAVVLAGLRSHYTMEAERRIHDQLCGAPQIVAANDAGDEDDLSAFML